MYRIIEEKRINDIYPTKSYFSDLDLFRMLSNENEQTAKLIGATIQDVKKVIDLGCGDASLLNRLLREAKISKLNTAHLIDLNPQVLDKAKQYLNEKMVAKELIVTCDDLLNQLPNCFNGMDAGFMIHVVYFLSTTQFPRVIESIPANFTLNIVLDKEDSVFSEIWKHTALKYYDRAMNVNHYLKNLNSNDFTVVRKTISSTIKNPFLMEAELKNKILSFISYKDTKDMSVDMYQRVKEIINQYGTEDEINVETNWFQITRK